MVSRRSGLGRGIGALIPSEFLGESTSAGDILRELAISHIEPNRHQPRDHWDESALSSLADSIRELGVLQPILVRSIAESRYELVAGERRWRAARQAGLATIPAIVRQATDDESLEQALVENLHREDLNALEEAAAYQQLIEEFHLTQDEVAKRVGKSRPAIANTLRLLHLPIAVQRLVIERRLSAGHARALLGSSDKSFQEALANRAIVDELTVRQVEEAVRTRVELGSALDQGAPAPGPSRPVRDLPPAGLLELEHLLADYLDTSVRVSVGRGRGKISIISQPWRILNESTG